MDTHVHFVEHNGDCWQSVFPIEHSHKSQLHTTTKDAIDYMVDECGVDPDEIKIIPRKRNSP